jgi:hypothetical protein
MPNAIKKVDGAFQVYNKKTGKIHAKHTTKEKAEAQLRLLNATEHNPNFKPRSKNEGVKYHAGKPYLDDEYGDEQDAPSAITSKKTTPLVSHYAEKFNISLDKAEKLYKDSRKEAGDDTASVPSIFLKKCKSCIKESTDLRLSKAEIEAKIARLKKRAENNPDDVEDILADIKELRASLKKVNEASKPDFLDIDKDDNKKESWKKALKDKKKKKGCCKESYLDIALKALCE